MCVLCVCVYVYVCVSVSVCVCVCVCPWGDISSERPNVCVWCWEGMVCVLRDWPNSRLCWVLGVRVFGKFLLSHLGDKAARENDGELQTLAVFPLALHLFYIVFGFFFVFFLGDDLCRLNMRTKKCVFSVYCSVPNSCGIIVDLEINCLEL